MPTFLIQPARNTGFTTRIIRWLQTRGYDRNILAVYEEALDDGEALITVPCAPADSHPLARLMLPHGAHGNHLLRSLHRRDVNGALARTFDERRASGDPPRELQR